MVGARRATIPESEAFRTRHEVPRVKKRQGMKLAPRDSLDVDRRIPVTEIHHQLLFCNCKLESLSLSDNKFTDNAAKDFAAALQHSNCKLESLHLCSFYLY